MALNDKQVYNLNNMNVAAQDAKLGDLVKNIGDASVEEATTEKAGVVRQASAVEDSSGASDSALETKFNELLASLRTAGILANE